MAILPSDLYSHGGIKPHHAGEEHMHEFLPGFREQAAEKHQIKIHKKENSGKAKAGGSRISPINVLFCIANKVIITEHHHLTDDRIKEILPWLYFSIKLDPHNVMGYTLTGYFLADHLDKTDEAINCLREGLKNNPNSWEINEDIGRLYLLKLKNNTIALTFLERAYVLISRVKHNKFQERFVLTLLSEAYKRKGEESKAIPLYKRIHELFPGDRIFQKKIDAYTST